MGLFLLLLLLTAVFASAQSALRRRVELAENRLVQAGDRVAALTERVGSLEALVAKGLRANGTPAPASVDERRDVAVPTPAVVELPREPTTPVAPKPFQAAPRAQEVIEPVVSAGALAQAPVPAEPAAAFALPVAAVASVAEAAAVDTPSAPGDVLAETATTAEAWEVVVGASWLNKIGVLIFVTGLALLLGYSMAHVGPAGRVAIGLAMSAALLGAGMVFERREPYRAYGLGLIAGGWAGAYVTAFAMRAIPAARIVESDAVGLVALLAVAAGMVAHSLRYRSETVTALAYAAAYVPLAITPLTSFSLAASVPLVVSLLVVAQRFGWSTISVLGLASTYGLFVLRGRVLPGDIADGTTLAPYALLAAYWLTFEIADIANLKRAPSAARAATPLFAANAVGYLGALVSIVDIDSTGLFALALAASALAYLGSAIVRSKLELVGPDTTESRVFTTVHGALALSAGLTAWAIDLRLAGPRETVLLLVEAELLLAASLALADRQLRRIGTAVAVAVSAHAIVTAIGWPTAVTIGRWTMAAWTPALAVVAAVWYANREWLRRRSVELDPVEHLYTWMALGFAGLITLREVSAPYQGLVGLMAAVALGEAGRRRRSEYTTQAQVVVTVAAAWVIRVFLFDMPLPSTFDVWRVLPAATLASYLYAWRNSGRSGQDQAQVSTFAAAVASCAGTAFIALLELRVVPGDRLTAAWALTALALVGTGAGYGVVLLRWQGYALGLLSAIPTAALLAFDNSVTGIEQTSVLGVVVALMVAGYVGRRTATAGLERHAAGALPFIAAATLTMFKWRVLPNAAIAPAWAVEAIVLTWLGRLRDRAGQRWQGYAVTLLALGYVSVWSASELRLAAGFGMAPAPTIFAAAGAVFLAAYGVTFLGRTRRHDPDATAATGHVLETAALFVLPALATYFLVVFEVGWFASDVLPFALALAAAALISVGLTARSPDIRVHAYVVLLAGAAAAWSSIVTRPEGWPVAWNAITIGLLYVTSLAMRAPLRLASAELNDQARNLESGVRIALSVIATLLLTVLIAREARPSIVTMGWGLEGTALLFAGFMARERALRLAGLGLLFLCILKLFFYDLRELEALARILSFVALGLVLLGVSWAYTRYKEDIRRLL